MKENFISGSQSSWIGAEIFPDWVSPNFWRSTNFRNGRL